MRHHQRRGAGRVVQSSNQIRSDGHRNRVEPRKRFVVHDHFRIQCNGTRQRNAPRHAAGYFRDPQRCRTAQAHCVEFHQHDVPNHRVVQIGVLTQRECDVLEDREVGEQRAELKQHAQATPQFEQLLGIARVNHLAVEAHLALVCRVNATNQAQERRLPAA